MKDPCAHERIYFGSGGHYIFCHGCTAVWCSRPEGDGALTADTYKVAMSHVCQTGPLGQERKP